MLPIIHAKFRRRHGVPFAIEQVSGRQFRCRHCNTVFYTEKQIDAHLRKVANTSGKTKVPIDPMTPPLSRTVEVRLLYTYDIKDHLQRKWLRLKRGDTYDGE